MVYFKKKDPPNSTEYFDKYLQLNLDDFAKITQTQNPSIFVKII